MKAILLSGYRAIQDNEEPLGLGRDRSGHRLIDRHIRLLTQLGLEVVCVLAGEDADRQLRLCPLIANTELAFDTNHQTHLASNAKAGLAAVGAESAFIIPVEIAPPPAPLWRAMTNEWRRLGTQTDVSALQAVSPQGAAWHFGFPLLITRAGNQLIQKLADFKSLADPRLLCHRVVYGPEGDLAPESKDA